MRLGSILAIIVLTFARISDLLAVYRICCARWKNTVSSVNHLVACRQNFWKYDYRRMCPSMSAMSCRFHRSFQISQLVWSLLTYVYLESTPGFAPITGIAVGFGVVDIEVAPQFFYVETI